MTGQSENSFDAIVIGASAGGLLAIGRILSGIMADCPLPIFVTKHISPDDEGVVGVLTKDTELEVTEALDKDQIVAGQVYIAPPNYHMLVESKDLICLSADDRVCHVRPSIDVLFQSAADAYGKKLIGIILTGANNDGAQGLKAIKDRGGLTIAQCPDTAEMGVMPKAAIATQCVDHILLLDDIPAFINKLASCQAGNKTGL